MLKHIQFIYFDCGGVVYKDFSDSNKWEAMHQDLGINESNQDKYQTLWSQIKNQVCIDYDVDDFISVLNQKLNLNIPSDYSMLQDFVDRFDPNPDIWPILEQLSQTHRLGLLTNQYPRMLDLVKQTDLIPPVDWDAIIDSNVVGHKKPETEIFEIALQQAGASPNQILFIDNSIRHVEKAQKLGWHAHHYDSADYSQATQLITKLLNH
jgi:putative hydrolase of the HAD superfamily